jgi:hypothetical protein
MPKDPAAARVRSPTLHGDPGEQPLRPRRRHAYQRWKERKLAAAPTALTDLVVEIGDPRALSDAEHDAILERCRRANMAIYIGTSGDDPDKAIPVALGARFGLHRLDHNRGADEDAVTSLTVQTDAAHRNYIPYSDRPIAWHTDGYYNTAGAADPWPAPALRPARRDGRRKRTARPRDRLHPRA